MQNFNRIAVNKTLLTISRIIQISHTGEPHGTNYLLGIHTYTFIYCESVKILFSECIFAL